MKSIITVFSDGSSFGKVALEHGQMLGRIFDAEVNTIFLDEKMNLKTVFSVADEGNTLCFVMPVTSQKKHTFFNLSKARKWIRKSRIPVLTIGNTAPKDSDYQQIILPLDINCQDKELALWASYFPAYIQKNCSHIPKENLLIHIIYNEYKDELLRQKTENNVAFVTKMFNNLEAPYQLHPFTNVDNIQTFGLQFAEKKKNSVMLFLMTEHYSLIDLIFGPIENKILGNKEQIPVLCLNAREDNFVLCR
jgi:hypothetical protein